MINSTIIKHHQNALQNFNALITGPNLGITIKK